MQPPEVFYEKKCIRNFVKIHRKTPAPESPFWSTAFLKERLCHRCFLVNFTKFLRTHYFYRTPQGDCFCIIDQAMADHILTSSTAVYLVNKRTSLSFDVHKYFSLVTFSSSKSYSSSPFVLRFIYSKCFEKKKKQKSKFTTNFDIFSLLLKLK